MFDQLSNCDTTNYYKIFYLCGQLFYQSLSKIHWITCYQVSADRPPIIYVHEPSLIVLVGRGCVKKSNIG